MTQCVVVRHEMRKLNFRLLRVASASASATSFRCFDFLCAFRRDPVILCPFRQCRHSRLFISCLCESPRRDATSNSIPDLFRLQSASFPARRPQDLNCRCAPRRQPVGSKRCCIDLQRRVEHRINERTSTSHCSFVVAFEPSSNPACTVNCPFCSLLSCSFPQCFCAEKFTSAFPHPHNINSIFQDQTPIPPQASDAPRAIQGAALRQDLDSAATVNSKGRLPAICGSHTQCTRAASKSQHNSNRMQSKWFIVLLALRAWRQAQ